MSKKLLYIFLTILFTSASLAYAEGDIKLPSPNTKGGRPLMEALSDRKSDRDFSTKPLSMQTLSDLLWAAGGINRPASGLRTAPTARNAQEIDIYVSMESGLYMYDPSRNELIKLSGQDIRGSTGKQPFVKDAPVNLIFVMDETKAASLGDKAGFYGACDTGYISQNVYLFCSSEGLATVARGWFDERALFQAMNLSNNKKIILTQTVGYRK